MATDAVDGLEIGCDCKRPGGKGKVNYSSAAEGLVALAENVTEVTGKIKATPKQERIIQGVSECARGAGDLLMQARRVAAWQRCEVSPALGPACPFVFGIGLAFNVAGVVMSITSAPSEGKPEALQPLGRVWEGFYGLGTMQAGCRRRLSRTFSTWAGSSSSPC